MRKNIFFDIDGTIISDDNKVSDKTKLAIKKLKENGHKLFICTGRTKGYVFDERIRSLGFDGYVYGCGTMLEYENKVFYEYRMDEDIVKKTYDVIVKHDIYAVYEGREKLYMSFENDLFHSTHKARLDAILKIGTQFTYACKIKNDLQDRLLDIKLSYPNIDASKVSVYINDEKARDEFLDVCKNVLNPISRGNTVFEMVPIGHSKGEGIKQMCKYANLDLSGLKPGEYRKLSNKEIAILYSMVK